MKLTDRQRASGASLTDLIHVVLTGDTSQNSAGSSYKIEMGAYKSLFTQGQGSYWISGSTGISSIKTINNSGLDALGNYSVAIGSGTTAYGEASFASGSFTIAGGSSSHAEGSYTQANNYFSHAEGYFTQANGEASHAEGVNTYANGVHSHAEGNNTQTYGQASHAEGASTSAIGNFSHSQNTLTQANGVSSHAGGSATTANGLVTFIHGANSQVNGNYSIVLGRNITGNTADTTYVDNLNIKNTAGTAVKMIGIDTNGKIVSVENLQKTISASTVLTSADNNYTILVDNGSNPINITIPTGLTANINVGFIQEGTGDVTFITSGTVIRTPLVGAFKIKGENYNAYLEQIGLTNQYHLLGNIKV